MSNYIRASDQEMMLTASPDAHLDPWIHLCKFNSIHNITYAATVDDEQWISFERYVRFRTGRIIRGTIKWSDDLRRIIRDTIDRIFEIFKLVIGTSQHLEEIIPCWSHGIDNFAKRVI